MAIANQDGYNTRCPSSRINPCTEGTETRRCYVRGERGHLARNCRSERNHRSESSNSSNRDSRRVNMAWVNMCDGHSFKEEQVYSGTRTRPKPYDINRRNHKEKRSESVKEFNLRSRDKLGPMQVNYNGKSTIIPTTHLDDQPLIEEIDEESDGGLWDELEYEKEELQEFEPYYSEECDVDELANDEEELKVCEDNPAVYLIEVDPVEMKNEK
ncbi:13456_t:CDS:2 [Gigaspora rosea]|nr:13456_t:CDS:2 [Gigaspora rosea]